MINEDRSMKDLHGIMENLHKKRAGMSAEQIIKEIKEGAEKIKKEYKANLRKPVSVKKKRHKVA